MIQQLIGDERFTNIQRAQAGLTSLFREADKNGSFFRVMKNDEPLGVLVPDRRWLSMLEDLEALASGSYQRRIAASRRSKTRITASTVKKRLCLS